MCMCVVGSALDSLLTLTTQDEKLVKMSHAS